MKQQLLYINSLAGLSFVKTLMRANKGFLQTVVPVMSKHLHAHATAEYGIIEDLGLIMEQGCERNVLVITPCEHMQTAITDLRFLESCGFTINCLPHFNSWSSYSISEQTVRQLKINQIIRYPAFDSYSKNPLDDQVVLITGAGGSIGSSLSQTVIQSHCKTLILIDHSEESVFYLKQDLEKYEHDVQVHFIVADIRDSMRMRQVFRKFDIDTVFHLAAYKHVALMEQDPYAAFQTNVMGTKNLFDTACSHGVTQFQLISTDKAVDPVCIMGLSKQLAEDYLLESEQQRMKVTILRFGNVLGSSGSVLGNFEDAVLNKTPLRISDKRMQRFFVLMDDLSKFLLSASAQGKHKDTLVFYIEEPSSILKLAKTVLMLSGTLKKTNEQLHMAKLLDAEKLSEVLIGKDEQARDTSHPQIKAISRNPAHKPINKLIDDINKSLASNGTDALEVFRALLSEQRLIDS